MKYASGFENAISASRSSGCESFWFSTLAVPSSTLSEESPMGPSLGARRGVTISDRSPNSRGTPACVAMMFS